MINNNSKIDLRYAIFYHYSEITISNVKN